MGSLSRIQLSDFTFTFHFSLSCIGEGNGNPLQCSCLENPRDGGAWWAALYEVAQSQTRLSDWTEPNWYRTNCFKYVFVLPHTSFLIAAWTFTGLMWKWKENTKVKCANIKIYIKIALGKSNISLPALLKALTCPNSSFWFYAIF